MRYVWNILRDTIIGLLNYYYQVITKINLGFRSLSLQFRRRYYSETNKALKMDYYIVITTNFTSSCSCWGEELFSLSWDILFFK